MNFIPHSNLSDFLSEFFNSVLQDLDRFCSTSAQRFSFFNSFNSSPSSSFFLFASYDQSPTHQQYFFSTHSNMLRHLALLSSLPSPPPYFYHKYHSTNTKTFMIEP